MHQIIGDVPQLALEIIPKPVINLILKILSEN
jgi:hypothetical protein